VSKIIKIFFIGTKLYFISFYLFLVFISVKSSINFFSILFTFLMLYFSFSVFKNKKWIFELMSNFMLLLFLLFIVLFITVIGNEYLKEKFQMTLITFIGIEAFLLTFILPYYFLKNELKSINSSKF